MTAAPDGGPPFAGPQGGGGRILAVELRCGCAEVRVTGPGESRARPRKPAECPEHGTTAIIRAIDLGPDASDTAPKATSRHQHHCRLCPQWLTSAEAVQEHVRRTHRIDGGLFSNGAWEPGVCGWCHQPVLPWQIGDHLRHGHAFGTGRTEAGFHYCGECHGNPFITHYGNQVEVTATWSCGCVTTAVHYEKFIGQYGAGGRPGWTRDCPEHGEVSFVSKRTSVVTDQRSTPFDREIAEAQQRIAADRVCERCGSADGPLQAYADAPARPSRNVWFHALCFHARVGWKGWSDGRPGKDVFGPDAGAAS